MNRTRIQARLGPEPEFVNGLRSPGIDSKESIPPAYVAGTVAFFIQTLFIRYKVYT